MPSDKTLKSIQKIASNSAVKVQKLINKSNQAMMDFNKKEALKQRTFSHDEGVLSRDFNSAEALKERQFNSAEAVKEREFNAAEAKKSRDWQEYMSNTSHQREVADLRAAGLNPVLSANGGAQSYTTSSASAGAASAGAASSSPVSGNSASAQLESGASSFANLMSTMMGNIVNMKSAEMSAKALEKSAATSAAATRYASDRAYEATKYNADTQYKIAMERPVSSLPALFDKYFGGDSTTQQKYKADIQSILKNPGAYLVAKAPSPKMTKNFFYMTKLGKAFADSYVRHAGVKNTDANKKLWYKAFVFGDQKAAEQWSRLAAYSNR